MAQMQAEDHPRPSFFVTILLFGSKGPLDVGGNGMNLRGARIYVKDNGVEAAHEHEGQRLQPLKLTEKSVWVN